MKLTFLGTAAGEGYPGLWCKCPNCTYARTHSGKNYRQNSCAIIDDDILLDMNMHTFDTAHKMGLDMTAVRYLLVTHPHEDHFISQHLIWRRKPPAMESLSEDTMHEISAPRFTPLPHLSVVGNAHTHDAMMRSMQRSEMENSDMTFIPVEDGVPLVFEGLTVVPVRSQHGPAAGFAHNYIITRGGKTLLYALDTGGYDPDMLEVLKAHCYDAVVMEGTFGNIPGMPGGHMNREKNRAMYAFFAENNLWKGAPAFYLSHLSPHWTPPHDAYAPQMAEEGMTVAYDGLCIEI